MSPEIAKADSSASLRNDKQKGQLQGQRQLRGQKQIPSLRCGMTNKKGKCKRKNNCNGNDRSRFLRCAAE
jgi:hypothetical protein